MKEEKASLFKTMASGLRDRDDEGSLARIAGGEAARVRARNREEPWTTLARDEATRDVQEAFRAGGAASDKRSRGRERKSSNGCC